MRRVVLASVWRVRMMCISKKTYIPCFFFSSCPRSGAHVWCVYDLEIKGIHIETEVDLKRRMVLSSAWRVRMMCISDKTYIPCFFFSPGPRSGARVWCVYDLEI